MSTNQQIDAAEREAIAREAFLIYQREGRPSGREMAHWLAAEQQIKAIAQAPAAKTTRNGSGATKTRAAAATNGKQTAAKKPAAKSAAAPKKSTRKTSRN